MSQFARDREAERRVGAQLAAHADSLCSRMLQVTVPIYLHAPPRIPELIGSGVLVTLGDDRFLFTAGHVFAYRKEGQLAVGTSPEYAGLRGTMWPLNTPNVPPGSPDDYLDLAIVQLRGEPWDAMPFARFCSWTELDIRPRIMERHSFGVIGFPVSKNRKPLHGDRLRAFAMPVAGLECERETYMAVSRDPAVNLMIGFDRKEMWGAGGKVTAPDPHGVSGGGMWRFGRKLREATRPPLLSAIAIEWHDGKNKHLLGTRIPLILRAMATKFPHVGQFIDAQSSTPLHA